MEEELWGACEPAATKAEGKQTDLHRRSASKWYGIRILYRIAEITSGTDALLTVEFLVHG
ncbi:hypothetical protein ACP70R_049581 [Stipagrostis hirtigluma subsp. patula]